MAKEGASVLGRASRPSAWRRPGQGSAGAGNNATLEPADIGNQGGVDCLVEEATARTVESACSPTTPEPSPPVSRASAARAIRWGRWPGFGVEGMIGEQMVRAVWADGRQLTCDRILDSQARLLVDQGAVFSCDDPPGRLWPACRPHRSRCS